MSASMSSARVAARSVPGSARSSRTIAAALVMAASGAAALGDQIAWTQRSASWLGHEAAAVLAVVTAFFGGIALGAWTLGPRIERSGRPWRWYVACELVIAAWGVVLVQAMSPASDAMLAMTAADAGPWRQWTIAFVGMFLILLPSTFAMGATLPALERMMTAWRRRGRAVGVCYAANTAGACVGVLGAVWTIPLVGLATTLLACSSLNVACALCAPWLFARSTRSDDGPVATTSSSAASSTWRTLAVTGLLGIGYEVMAVRVLSQVTEDTVYTFALLLAVYLSGHAAGAAVQARGTRRRRREISRDRLPVVVAIACLVGVAGLYASDASMTAWRDMAPAGVSAALAGEASLAIIAFAVPTFAMGALFAQLCSDALDDGISFGRAIAINTAGGAMAPIVFGVVLAPAFGAKRVLLVIAFGYLVLATARAWRTPWPWLAASAVAIAAIAAPPLMFVDVPHGGRVVSYREGTMGAVSVVADADDVLVLKIDNRQQEGSSATRYVDARQGVLPILLHPAPSSALFLGLGTGVTARAAAHDPSLSVDAVELLPEVVAASDRFVAAAERDAHRMRIHVADARRYVRTVDRSYDVIVADNVHPARSGSGALYTVEHFAAVRDRLNDGGVFCQWLPLHQLDLDTARSIVASFIAVFPRATAMLANNGLDTPVVGLVGHRGPRSSPALDPARLRDRLSRASGLYDLAGVGLDDEFAVLGGFFAGPDALARFASHAPVNTDDRPVVAYRAPHATYAADSRPRDRLMSWLERSSIVPDDVTTTGDDRWAHRLSSYWTARDRFIAAGRDVRPTDDARAMLAQVRDPLLAVLRISPDFAPAYRPLVAMADALESADPSAARSLRDAIDAIRRDVVMQDGAAVPADRPPVLRSDR